MCMLIQVEVKDRAVRTISLINLGQYLFNYSWELRLQSSLGETGSTVIAGHGDDSVLSLLPLSGSIAQGEKAACLLTFMPPVPLSLKNCELVLKVMILIGLYYVIDGIFVNCNQFRVVSCFLALSFKCYIFYYAIPMPAWHYYFNTRRLSMTG